MSNCNKVGGGQRRRNNKTQKRRKRQMSGGSSNMAGSPYQGESPVVQQGSPYFGVDLKGDTSLVAGSYAPLQKSAYQCGGRRRQRKTQKRQQQRKQQRRQRNTQKRQQKQRR